MAGLSDNASKFTLNLRRNFDLLCIVTGLTLTFLPEQSTKQLVFGVNALQLKYFAFFGNETKLQNTGLSVTGIVRWILTLRLDVDGSQHNVRGKFVNSPPYGAVLLKKQKTLVGACIGAFVPVFFIVAVTAGAVLVTSMLVSS